jgi:hypothetical protein
MIIRNKLSTSLLLFLVLTIPCIAHTASDIPPPEILKAINDVTVKEAKKESWLDAEVGQLLFTDDRIKTGQESRAEVDTHSGVIRLYQNALLIIPELSMGTGKKEPQGVLLTKGAGIFRLAPRKDKRIYTVTTNQVSLIVKATIFSVILEGKELYEQEVTKAIRSFTAMDISGAVVVERWVDPVDGTVYSLMKLDKGLVQEHLEELELSKPSKIYVRKAFSDAQFRLETEEKK